MKKGRKNVLFEDRCERFWTSISCEGEFQSGTTKDSSIIYSVLKVTHQIIVFLLFHKEEISKENKKELEHLWCMIHKPKEVPHFRCSVIQKMLKNSMRNGG